MVRLSKKNLKKALLATALIGSAAAGMHLWKNKGGGGGIDGDWEIIDSPSTANIPLAHGFHDWVDYDGAREMVGRGVAPAAAIKRHLGPATDLKEVVGHERLLHGGALALHLAKSFNKLPAKAKDKLLHVGEHLAKHIRPSKKNVTRAAKVFSAALALGLAIKHKDHLSDVASNITKQFGDSKAYLEKMVPYSKSLQGVVNADTENFLAGINRFGDNSQMSAARKQATMLAGKGTAPAAQKGTKKGLSKKQIIKMLAAMGGLAAAAAAGGAGVAAYKNHVENQQMDILASDIQAQLNQLLNQRAADAAMQGGSLKSKLPSLQKVKSFAKKVALPLGIAATLVAAAYGVNKADPTIAATWGPRVSSALKSGLKTTAKVSNVLGTMAPKRRTVTMVEDPIDELTQEMQDMSLNERTANRLEGPFPQTPGNRPTAYEEPMDGKGRRRRR